MVIQYGDHFSGGEVTNLLFNLFEGSNEEIMSREQKEEVLWWNLGKHGQRGRTCKNPWDSLCMICVYDGPMETTMLNTCGWIKIEFRHEGLWCGKKAMSNLHDINYGRWPILLPWRFPGRQVPALTIYTTNHPQLSANIHQLHRSHTLNSPSFCKSQLTSPAHNVVIPVVFAR